MLNSTLKLSLCRTCLATLLQSNAYNIFDTLDLAKKLMLCSGQPVEITDEYPENVCVKCYEHIIQFNEFQQMCCKSLLTFREFLKSEETLKEASDKGNIHSDNHTEDTLNEDLKVSSPLKDNIQILNEFSEKKKRGRSPKKKSGYQMANRKTTAGVNFSGDKMKDELQEYFHYDMKTEVCLENEDCSAYKESLDEQACKSLFTNKTKEYDLSKEHQCNTKEEKFSSEAESCSSTQEFITIQKQIHQCDFCSKRFKSLLRFKAHMRQHDGLTPYICTFVGCERSFDNWYFYNKHQSEHILSQEENFTCDVDNCKRVYKNKSNLNIHKRKFHNLGPQMKTHMCEICGKVFKSSAVLNDHHYTHIDKTQLPYACEEKGCIKRFSNKEKLKIHKMRHAGIKNFTCSYCGMRKTTRNELKIHINYHTLEKTWPCRFCPKVCNSAGNLKMHVKNMHERAKDFSCRYCDRTFAKADTRKYHEMTHTGEKPHECKECGRRFVQPAALRTHRKIHLRQKGEVAESRKVKMASAKERQNVMENTSEDSIVAEILSDSNEK